MVAEIDLKSIPATQSLTVFEGRYWSLQKLHSCFHIVVDSFLRNFKFSNDRKKSLRSGFHYTTNATTTTQKQSDYKVEQSSFSLIALFWLEIVVVICLMETRLNDYMETRLKPQLLVRQFYSHRQHNRFVVAAIMKPDCCTFILPETNLLLVTPGNPQRCNSMIAELSIQLNFMWVCLHGE